MVEGCNDADLILNVLNVNHLVPGPSAGIGNSGLTSTWAEGVSSAGVISFTDEDDLVDVSVSPNHIPSSESSGEQGAKLEQEQRHVQLPRPTAASSLLAQRGWAGEQRERNGPPPNFHLDAIENEEELHRRFFAKWLKVCGPPFSLSYSFV